MLTSITGVMSTSTSGVSVIDPFAGWPDLGAWGMALSDPNHFGLHADETAACGVAVDTTIDLTYAQGVNSTSLLLPVGSVREILLLSEDFSAGIPCSTNNS